MGAAPESAPDARGAYALAPLLSVRGGARAVAFYQSAFGAEDVYRVEDPDGAVVARLAVGRAAQGAEAAEFWVNDEAPARGAFSPESVGGGTARLILTGPDSDAVVARALAAGARVVAPVEEADGLRLSRVLDPFGHTWEIGRPLAPWYRTARRRPAGVKKRRGAAHVRPAAPGGRRGRRAVRILAGAPVVARSIRLCVTSPLLQYG